MKNTIVQANVIGKKIPFNNGIMWEVEGKQYKYGWAYVRPDDSDKKFVDVTHAPDGTELMGDILVVQRPNHNGERVTYTNETVFQPHDGTVTEVQGMQWFKAHWIKCFGNDNHFYNDVESVTYKDPKTGKERTSKCYGISIQKEVNVIVWRSGGKTTKSIPIKNVIKRHLNPKYQ